MVNVPPPLLCSTPPPIDFGEDDDDSGLQSTLHLEDGDGDADEYSEYGLVTETRHEATLNTKAEPAPPPDLRNGHATATATATATAKPTVEAFNYQVKSPALDDALFEAELPPTLGHVDTAEVDEVDRRAADEEEQEEEEEEANTNDNIPSLKLDSLSLYSSESGTLSPVADEPEQIEAAAKQQAPVLCHQVTLEDVTDDSDEECSPKKPKELFIPEGADNFFAIEIVATPSVKEAPTLSIQQPTVAHNFAAFQETPPEDIPQVETNTTQDANEDEDDDFGDFADFSEAPAPVVQSPAAVATTPPPVAAAPVQAEPVDNDDDDGFDDFQDFATPPVEAANIGNDDEDDDEFGDFSEPSFVSAEPAVVPTVVAPVLPQPPPPAATLLSITERVKPVLDLMFPQLEASSDQQNAAKQAPLADVQSLHFGAIEQAHALDYQWVSSEMRHSLVRSLGIDSRNILFGDKWNSSMPRFAANLSYDPLKPLKPMSATPSVVLDPQLSTMSSWQPANNCNNNNSVASQLPLEAQPGLADGQGKSEAIDNSSSSNGGFDEAISGNGSSLDASHFDDAAAAASVFAAAAATATLSPALSADGNGHHFDDGEQLAQPQQQLDLRSSPSPSPTPPPPAPPTTTNTQTQSAATVSGSQQQLHEVSSNSSSSNSYALPLKETHIYTPSKSDTAVAKTTTLAPIDFDYEIASAGIIIDETVVKKEYRDVEYKPPFGLDSPSKVAPTAGSNGKPASEDDDFSDFQSVSVPVSSMSAIKNTAAQLQPPRNGTPTFGEQMILSPAILLPQTIPLAKPSIEWGDNALASINAEELARIEELFSHQSKPPTISATVAQQSPKQQPKQHHHQQQQQQEDDEWSDFVSVPVQQQQQHLQNNHNNNVVKAQKPQQTATAVAKEDDWSDFVSSTPLATNTLNSRAAPQFNSGAWQSANFYNNPMSLYQQQQQPLGHSNVVPKYQSNTTNSSSSNNNNNNVPQQIHMMHDFSTAPTATPLTTPATYQQQHHQHHQQQLQQQQLQLQQQQQRQQFHLGNAKVAPRISLIPDLSFVAPALPTNAGAFMSSLPKPSFSAKK
ncbi:hypothetical protein KR093_004086 [Drosophila rubida]|uniref:Aftiphilin clathrin-binding box domain-containing protein n=1 Tax=Drosophila rubida TaxID=30044 RepID=A0AAD4PHS9_9MUSC|nr:hypothetical protein KR093_004086 [Drosophila rubida]